VRLQQDNIDFGSIEEFRLMPDIAIFRNIRLRLLATHSSRCHSTENWVRSMNQCLGLELEI
jgi:hypothetical protein